MSGAGFVPYRAQQHALSARQGQSHFLCGVKPPYKLLLDGSFVATCMQMKVDIHERLPKVLQVKPREVQHYIPRAALDELELLGEAMRPAFEVVQSLIVVEDDSDRGGAAQGAGAIAGVPLFYLTRSVLVFEDISRATLAIVRQEEESSKRSKLEVHEKRKLGHMAAAAADENSSDDEQEQQRLTKARARHEEVVEEESARQEAQEGVGSTFAIGHFCCNRV
ncbi:Rrna-processing protein [Globisporangium polare]